MRRCVDPDKLRGGVTTVDEENLISKKDVLLQTDISYGQLYRWRRKGLIPEAWFVRRSTFTGQETFFPRDKILERIERVKAMKDTHPLDDLADVITQEVNAKVRVTLDCGARRGSTRRRSRSAASSPRGPSPCRLAMPCASRWRVACAA
jgi:hypothetical protein